VILEEKAFTWAFDDPQGFGRPYWVPSAGTIAAAEAQLSSHVQALPAEGNERLKSSLSSYGRQYVGVTKSGVRVLVINGFCGGLDFPRARTEFVMVADGGSCFFQAYYDADAAKLMYVDVNGVA
jgi:hypothetical protein